MQPFGYTNFKLEKHYLDCIDNEGNCFIVYQAILQFLFLKINYSSLLFSDYKNFTIEKASLKKPEDPVNVETLKFSHAVLKIMGNWNRVDKCLPPLSLGDIQNHELIWNCHHPKTFTEIVYNKRTFTGFGYADTISMTLRPGNLPIEELRWGRFHSESRTLIWIYIKGHLPVNKLFLDGKEYNDAIFENDRIVFDNCDYELSLSEKSVIREGKLANIFSGMSWLKIFFNSRMLNTLEIKYKAKASLSYKNKISAYGWSLYEKVIWGR